jgi:hypothetical protein
LVFRGIRTKIVQMQTCHSAKANAISRNFASRIAVGFML